MGLIIITLILADRTRPTSCTEVECQNGGACVEADGYAKCECADGFVGRQCELECK